MPGLTTSRNFALFARNSRHVDAFAIQKVDGDAQSFVYYGPFQCADPRHPIKTTLFNRLFS
jgi:hypothetical protein